MSYTMDDFRRDYVKEHLKDLTPEERLAGLAPEDLCAALPPQKYLQGLSPEELEALLAHLQKPAPPTQAE